MVIRNQLHRDALSSGLDMPNADTTRRPARNVSGQAIVAGVSWFVACIIDGLATYGEARFSGLAKELFDQREPEPSLEREGCGHTKHVQTPQIWITSRISSFRSWHRREREVRRTAALLEALDDRTLKDIGIYRCEIESVARRQS
jgi:uncharacterized protein YjiS (DUF1127 family)